MRFILTTIVVIAFLANPLAAHELKGTLQQIKETGKIRIGYRQSQPPMSFSGKDGKPAGYSIDLCLDIVNEVKNKIDSKIEIEYVPVTAKDRFVAVSENKIDILCGSTTKTLSRSEVVAFTQLTFVTGASFMSLKGTRIKNNFEGKKIGVVKGTTTAVALKELFQDASVDAEIILLNTTAEALDSLKKEKIDGFSADQVVLIGLVLATDDPGSYSILSDLFSYEPFALAVRRNDADFRLIADRVISKLYRTKQILQIYDKWFGKFSSRRTSGFDALIKLNAISE
jgi:glutamate/aspartate transport system substrate-binding protein